MGNRAMKAMMAAGGLPALGDAEAWARIGAWWREKGEFEDDLEQRVNELEAAAEEHDEQLQGVQAEAKAARENVAEMQHARDMSARELEAARADNAALRKVIDKFTMAALGESAARVVAQLPPEKLAALIAEQRELRRLAAAATRPVVETTGTETRGQAPANGGRDGQQGDEGDDGGGRTPGAR